MTFFSHAFFFFHKEQFIIIKFCLVFPVAEDNVVANASWTEMLWCTMRQRQSISFQARKEGEECSPGDMRWQWQPAENFNLTVRHDPDIEALPCPTLRHLNHFALVCLCKVFSHVCFEWFKIGPQVFFLWLCTINLLPPSQRALFVLSWSDLRPWSADCRIFGFMMVSLSSVLST